MTEIRSLLEFSMTWQSTSETSQILVQLVTFSAQDLVIYSEIEILVYNT